MMQSESLGGSYCITFELRIKKKIYRRRRIQVYGQIIKEKGTLLFFLKELPSWCEKGQSGSWRGTVNLWGQEGSYGE